MKIKGDYSIAAPIVAALCASRGEIASALAILHAESIDARFNARGALIVGNDTARDHSALISHNGDTIRAYNDRLLSVNSAVYRYR